MYNVEKLNLESILYKGTIESQEDFSLFLEFHDYKYNKNPDDLNTATFVIHLPQGKCEMTATEIVPIVSDEILPMKEFCYYEPLKISFYDELELPVSSYKELKWNNYQNHAILYDYKLTGTTLTVAELKAISQDFLVWTKPSYNRDFLRTKKMVLDTYIIDGEIKILFVYFRFLEDIDVENTSINVLSQTKIEITRVAMKEVKYGEYQQRYA